MSLLSSLDTFSNFREEFKMKMSVRFYAMAALLAAMALPAVGGATTPPPPPKPQPMTNNHPEADAAAKARAEAAARAELNARLSQEQRLDLTLTQGPNTAHGGTGGKGGEGGKGGDSSLTVGEGALSPRADATGIKGDVNLEGSRASVGDISNDSKGGDAKSNATINYKIPLPAPGVLTPMITTPDVPFAPQNGANVRGMQLIDALETLCATSMEENGYRYKQGVSNTTDISFVAYTDRAIRGPKSKTPPVLKVESTARDLAGDKELYFRCIGTMQVEGRSKYAERVSLAVLRNDAAQFVRGHVRGGDNLALLSDECSVSATTGAESRGIGLGASSGVTAEPGSVLSTALGGITGNRGRTFPSNKIGNTFGVVQPAEGPGPGVFKLSDLAKLLYPDHGVKSSAVTSTVAPAPTPAMIVSGQ
jgi:hypothetical protein